MTIFAAPVFDATVIFEGNELFKGQGSASMWAEKLAQCRFEWNLTSATMSTTAVNA